MGQISMVLHSVGGDSRDPSLALMQVDSFSLAPSDASLKRLSSEYSISSSTLMDPSMVKVLVLVAVAALLWTASLQAQHEALHTSLTS